MLLKGAVTDPMQNQALSFVFLDFSKLLIHNISPFQQLFCQAMEFHVLAKDPLQLMLPTPKCPLLEGADLVSLNESCYFNSTFGACAPKILSSIFCCCRATWLDALSLFFFLFDAVTFHFITQNTFL